MANLESNTLLEKLTQINSIKNKLRQTIISIGGGDYIDEQSPFAAFPRALNMTFSDIKNTSRLLEYVDKGGVLEEIAEKDKLTYLDTVPYIEELLSNKQTLVDNLRVKGVYADITESFASLINKVLRITGGEPGPEPPEPGRLLYSTIVTRGEYSVRFEAIDLGEAEPQENDETYYKIEYKITNISGRDISDFIIKFVLLTSGETSQFEGGTIYDESFYSTIYWYNSDNYTNYVQDFINSNVSVFLEIIDYCSVYDLNLFGDNIGYPGLTVTGTRYVSQYLGVSFIIINQSEPYQISEGLSLNYIDMTPGVYGFGIATIFFDNYEGNCTVLVPGLGESSELFLSTYNDSIDEWSFEHFLCLYIDYSNNYDDFKSMMMYSGEDNLTLYQDIIKINNIGVYARNILYTDDESEINYDYITMHYNYYTHDDNNHSFTKDTSISNKNKVKIRKFFSFYNEEDTNSCFKTLVENFELSPRSFNEVLLKSVILSNGDTKVRYRIFGSGGCSDSDGYYIRREVTNLNNYTLQKMLITETYTNEATNIIDWWFNYHIYNTDYYNHSFGDSGEDLYNNTVNLLLDNVNFTLHCDGDYTTNETNIDLALIGYNDYTANDIVYYAEDIDVSVVSYTHYSKSSPEEHEAELENGLCILAIDIENEQHRLITYYNKNDSMVLRSTGRISFNENLLDYILFEVPIDDYDIYHGTYTQAYEAYLKYYGGSKDYDNYVFSDYSGINTYSYTTLENVSNVYDLNETQSIAIVDEGNNTVKAVPIHSSNGLNTTYISKITVSNNTYMVNNGEEAEIILPDYADYNKMKNKDYTVIFDTLDENSKISTGDYGGGSFYNYILRKNTAKQTNSYYWLCPNVGGVFVRALFNIDSSFEGLAYITLSHISSGYQNYDNYSKMYINKGETRDFYATAYFSSFEEGMSITCKFFADVLDVDKGMLSNYVDSTAVHDFNYWYWANTKNNTPLAEFIRELEPNKSALMMVTMTPSRGSTEYYVKIFHKFYINKNDKTECVVTYKKDSWNVYEVDTYHDGVSGYILSSGNNGAAVYEDFKENYKLEYVADCPYKELTYSSEGCEINAKLHKGVTTNTLILKYTSTSSTTYNRIYLKDANGTTKLTAYSGVPATSGYVFTTNSIGMDQYSSIEEAFDDIVSIDVNE